MWSGEIATYLGEMRNRGRQAKGIPVAWTIINGPHFMPYFNIFPVHCMYPRFAMLHVRNTWSRPLRTCWDALQETRKSMKFCFFLLVFLWWICQLMWNLVLMGLFSTSLLFDSNIFNVRIHYFFFFNVLCILLFIYHFSTIKILLLAVNTSGFGERLLHKNKTCLTESNFCSHW